MLKAVWYETLNQRKASSKMFLSGAVPRVDRLPGEMISLYLMTTRRELYCEVSSIIRWQGLGAVLGLARYAGLAAETSPVHPLYGLSYRTT